jgi:hypothetical protein
MTAMGRIKGRNYDFRQGRRWRHTRLAVLRRDGYRCRYCGKPATTVDHVRRVEDGGDWYDMANLVAACVRCNTSRNARSSMVFRGTVTTSLAIDALHTHHRRHATVRGDYSRRTADAGDRTT